MIENNRIVVSKAKRYLIFLALAALVILLILVIVFAVMVGNRMTKFGTWENIIPLPVFPVKCYSYSAAGDSRVACYPFFDRRFWSEPPNLSFSSFPGHVLVMGKGGEKYLISNIKIGDQIVGYDVASKHLEVAEVTQVHVREDGAFIRINDSLLATPEHPFAVLGEDGTLRWEKAKNIKEGYCLYSEEESCVLVERVESLHGPVRKVYNMHVAGPETYFVYMNGDAVLVHNKTLPMPSVSMP